MAEAEEGEEPEPEAESRTWLEIFEVGLEELTGAAVFVSTALPRFELTLFHFADAIKRFGDGYQTATDSFVSEQGMKVSSPVLVLTPTLFADFFLLSFPFCETVRRQSWLCAN